MSRTVLFVSKPLTPPWRDGSKNLTRDIAAHLTRYRAEGFSDADAPPLPGVELRRLGEPLRPRIALSLALDRRADLWHFVSAPYRPTSIAASTLSTLRRRPTVQTVASRPPPGPLRAPLLFGDRVVVLSRWMERELLGRGADPRRLLRIPPAVPPLAPLDEAARTAARRRFDLPVDRPVVLFPGDLEVGEGAARLVTVFAGGHDALLVMACRDKTPAARERRRELARLAPEVRWLGEVDRMHDLLGAADVVAFPSRDLSAKVDLPLVLLEAAWLSRPILVAEGSPPQELALDGGALAVGPTEDALRRGLDRLLREADAFGAGARALAEARFHPRRMAEAYEAVYDELP
jgi:glycosyltransferase involved in cell wall biosynthesis